MLGQSKTIIDLFCFFQCHCESYLFYSCRKLLLLSNSNSLATSVIMIYLIGFAITIQPGTQLHQPIALNVVKMIKIVFNPWWFLKLQIRILILAISLKTIQYLLLNLVFAEIFLLLLKLKSKKFFVMKLHYYQKQSYPNIMPALS